MKFDQFAYWLQGYFELRNDHCSLSLEQVSKICNHIKLVETCSKNEPIHSMLGFLKGLLFQYEAASSNQRVAIAQKIQKELSELFKHEIDPKMEPDPKFREELQRIHDGLEKSCLDTEKLEELVQTVTTPKLPKGGIRRPFSPGRTFTC